MTKDEVLKLVLDVIKDLLTEFRPADLPYGSKAYAKGNNAVHALEESLAKPRKEPVAYVVYPRSIHRTYPELTFTKPEPSSDTVVVSLYVCAND
jgi:uncharacterized protein YfeS